MPSLRTSRATRKPVVGLNIEPGGAHAAQVTVNGRLTIDRHASVDLDPGVVRDGEVVDADALANALQELFTRHKLDRTVRMGIANQRVVMRHIMLPPIDNARELSTAVRFEAESVIPMPLDQVVLDHASLGVVDTPSGPRQRVVVVAARRDMVERLLSAAHAAKLKPEGVDLSSFAMARALAAPEDGLVVHVSIGGVVNLAATVGRECVFSRTVPGGLEPMALDLAERTGITVTEARLIVAGTPAPLTAPVSMPLPSADADLLVDGDIDASPGAAGTRPEQDQVATAAQRVLDDGLRRICTEIRNSIDFHLSGEDQGLPLHTGTVERVALTGPGITIPGLAEAFETQLGLPVVLADVTGGDERAPGSHAVAAGLAVEDMAA